MPHLNDPLRLVSCLLLASACGPVATDLELAEGATSDQDIINGEACGPERLPSAVAILIDADIDFFGQTQRMRQPICTGTLIAPDAVLAAAHCFDSSLLTMGMGSVTRELYGISFAADLTALAEDQQGTTPWPDDAIEATEWYGHPDFNIDNMNNVNGPGDFNDVGIMFLSEAVTSVEPMLLIGSDEVDQLIEDASVEIAGWGQQTPTSGFEPAPPGSVGAKRCATSFVNELGEKEMQIGGDESTSRKCHGDSGGPTYLTVTSDHARDQRLVGITSHAYNDQDCALGGVDTRVDVWWAWIDQQMRDHCADDSRVWCEEPGVLPTSFFDPPATPDAGGGSGGSAGSGGDIGDESSEQGCPCSAGSSRLSWPLAAVLSGLLFWRRRR